MEEMEDGMHKEWGWYTTLHVSVGVMRERRFRRFSSSPVHDASGIRVFLVFSNLFAPFSLKS